MANKIYNVLFVCTGNSARSIIAEAVLNKMGAGRFRAFSAGSRPRGTVHPMALKVLAAQGYDTEPLRSKSWEEFAAPGAPPMDLIFDVCDRAASETGSEFPGLPITGRWRFADPAAVEGDEDAQHWAFAHTEYEIALRLRELLALPLETLDRVVLQSHLNALGACVTPSPEGL